LIHRTERVLIGLGGNLGDPAASMRKALRLIDAHNACTVTEVSSFWRTPPWGKTDQPDFINACAAVETSLTPQAFLALCLDIETQLHRIRTERWGPRSIDIDILFFGEREISEEGLTVPHPRIAERAFVLVPLAEIAGDVVLDGRTVRELADGCERTGMVRVGWGDLPVAWRLRYP
jgi:2-amino-4-hydroxy-6-hydroxymethyldihydropteridine diphosphokinase